MTRYNKVNIAAAECTKMDDYHGRRCFKMGVEWADGNPDWHNIFEEIRGINVFDSSQAVISEDTTSLLSEYMLPFRALCAVVLKYENDEFKVVYECFDYDPDERKWVCCVSPEFLEKNLIGTETPLDDWNMSAEGYMSLKYSCEESKIVSFMFINDIYSNKCMARPWNYKAPFSNSKEEKD